MSSHDADDEATRPDPSSLGETWPYDGETQAEDEDPGPFETQADDEEDPELFPPCRDERGRPGRFRCWVLRPFFWGLALLAVFVGVAQLLLDTSYVRKRIGGLVESYLGEFLDREVHVERISLQLVPPSVEAWGFTISGPKDLDTEEPFLSIPWVSVDLDLSALENNVFRIEEIRLERPRVYLAFFPEGESNVLNLQSKNPGRPKRFEVWIDRIEIEKAEVFLDQEAIRMSIAGDSVRARLEGLGDRYVGGQAVVQNVVLRLPNARPYQATIAARGSVRRGRVEIETARVNGPDLFAMAHGTCEWPKEDPSDKKCQIDVEGKTRGEVLAQLGYFRDLQGELDFDGAFTWRPRIFGWRSQVTSPLVHLWGRRLTDFQGTLNADRYSAHLAIEKALYGDGTIDGSFDVETARKGRPSSVTVRFHDVLLDALLADQGIPAGPCASRVDGSLVYEFPFGDGTHGDGHGEVKLRQDQELGGLPLTGSFPLRIDEGIVRTGTLALRSDRQSVLASGWYDTNRRRGLFEYEVASADLRQLAYVLRLAPAEGEPWPEWLPTSGEGRLKGSLHLVPGEAATEVNLDLEKVLGPSVRSPQDLVGSLRVDKRQVEPLRVQLSDATSALMIEGRIPLTDDDPQGFVLAFDAFNWPLQAVRPWLDFDFPLDGRISGRLDLVAVGEDSEGRLSATVSPALLAGIPFDEAASHLHWDARKLYFEDLRFTAPAGEVWGHGDLAFGTEALDLDLRSATLQIGASPLRSFLPRDDLAGEVRTVVHVAGTLERPELDLEVEADGITLAGRRLDGRPSKLAIHWADGQLTAAGRLLDLATLEGGGSFDTVHGDVVFDVDGNDLAGLAEILTEDPPQELDGTFAGTLRVWGTVGEMPDVALVLNRLAVDFHDRSLKNLEPVRLRLFDDHLQIESLYLAEEATESELFLTGVLGYQDTDPVDLRLQATISNSWLRFYEPDIRVDGFFDVLGRVGGTVGRIYLDGQGAVRDGRVVLEAIPDFPHTFENLEGLLLFYPDGVVVDHLETQLAEGSLRIEGTARFPHAGEPLDYSLQVHGRDLRVRYPLGWLMAGDLETTLRTQESPLGPPKGTGQEALSEGEPEVTYLVTGRADLEALEFTEDIPVGFSQIVEDVVLRQRLEVELADPLLSAIQFNVVVNGPQALRVKNNAADLKGGVELVLRGSLAQPLFFGNVDLTPGGKILYSGVDYQIDRGRLSFANPYELDPEVDLVATTRVRDFEVELTLSGTVDRLNAGFSSNPPLPALEVFELLATGGKRDQVANTVRRADEIGEENSMSAASFLYGQAASVIGERVSNLFGFDKFRIDPQTGSGDNLSSARVTVGKRLSKDIFLSYSADPSSTEEQQLQIEWRLGRNLTLVLTQNGDNTYEADARWETTF